MHGGQKPWKNIYGAGQGVGSGDRIVPVATVAAQLVAEYQDAHRALDVRRGLSPV